MESLKQIFSRKPKNSVLMKSIQASLAVEFTQKLLKNFWGDGLDNQVRVLHLKNSIITIACLSSVLASEIKFKEIQLLEEINKQFGESTVSKLKIIL